MCLTLIVVVNVRPVRNRPLLRTVTFFTVWGGSDNPPCKKKEECIMPGFDRTGPTGMGPKTGGGRGFCGTGALRNPAGAGWFGRGRGMGRGLLGMGLGLGGYFLRPWARRGFFPSYNPTSEEEASQVKEEASSLRDVLNSIERRLGKLEKQNVK